MQTSPLCQKVQWVCLRTLQKKRNFQLSVCLDLNMFARSLNFTDSTTLQLCKDSEIRVEHTVASFFVARLVRGRSCKGNADLLALGQAR